MLTRRDLKYLKVGFRISEIVLMEKAKDFNEGYENTWLELFRLLNVKV